MLVRVFLGLLDEQVERAFWEAKLDLPQAKKTKKLVCNIYQCKNLPPADPTGLADPYVKILCGASEVSTDKKGKLGILNPLWYESYSIDVAIGC